MGTYKEKNCKFCGISHRKRGPYCSQACSNKDREPTENMRNHMRKIAEDYNRTPEAIANQKAINTSLNTLSAEDYALDIPEFPELPDGYNINEF